MLALNRVVSLRDMLEKLDGERLVEAVSYLSSCAVRYRGFHTALTRGQAFDANFDEEGDLKAPFRNALVVERIATQLGMAGVALSAQQLQWRLNDYGQKSAPAEREPVFDIYNALHNLLVSFGNELDGRKLFVMGPKYGGYFDPPEPLFGQEVNDAFPSAAPEVEEAGKCIAMGRWTASVMHLMRALEPALMAFQAYVGVAVPKINWQDVLNQVDATIKANGPKHPDHAWNSEASLHFLRFKDALRNYAMHGRDRYDEERALVIYGGVRAFMRHLSSRLRE